jgi:predicted transcriptional regulator of viral defense system
MKTPIIWKKLLLDKRKIVLSKDIHAMARQLNKNEKGSVDYLQRHGYIVRILRGFYYVKTPEERQLNKLDNSIHEIIAMVLKEKGVNKWYFGLETALKFNNMTHEYFSVNYVITNSYETTKTIKILDTKFRFLKWNDKHFTFGITKEGQLRYSDKEKTVLDIAYRTYRNKTKDPYILNLIREYSSQLDNEKLMDYLTNYSVRFQKLGEQL